VDLVVNAGVRVDGKVDMVVNAGVRVDFKMGHPKVWVKKRFSEFM
jgi:hypothetical protein